MNNHPFQNNVGKIKHEKGNFNHRFPKFTKTYDLLNMALIKDLKQV